MESKEIQQTFENWLRQYFPATTQSLSENETNLQANPPPPSSSSVSVSPNPTTQPTTNEHNNVVIQPENSNPNFPGLIINPELKNGSVKVFDNQALSIYVLKAVHQRQKVFRFQDTMFHIKIEQKNEHEQLFLQDLLEIFYETFKYILDHLKKFFSLADHNIAYLTLFQEPMVNGLNTGGFDIEHDSKENVNKLLAMLQQFLISNQELSLNNSFKVYINVLSIDKERYVSTKKRQQPSRIAKKIKKTQIFWNTQKIIK